MKIVTVYSTKGGVGKTTTAINLAWEATQPSATEDESARRDSTQPHATKPRASVKEPVRVGSTQRSRVLLWDLDPQGASTFLLGVKPKLKSGADALVRGRTNSRDAIRSTSVPGLDILPADASYRDLDLLLDAAKNSTSRIGKVAASVAANYDILVLDCPPGESLVARNALEAADLIVVPLPPSPLDRRSLDQIRALRDEGRTRARLLGFLSMVDRRKTVHRVAVDELPTDDLVAIVVPAASVVERMGIERAPLGTFAAGSAAAAAYRELWALARTALKLDEGGTRRKGGGTASAVGSGRGKKR